MKTPCLTLLKRSLTPYRNAGNGVSSSVILALLLLAGLPAQAANYTFPGALPPGCTDSGNGNYACGTLTLIDGDKITIATPKPATINFSGAFTTGSGTQINAAGASADLTINAGAAVTVGFNVTLNGNILSSAAVTTGPGTTINGYILTTLPTGVVTIGNNNRIGGYIKTDGGAVTIGASSVIDGSLRTEAGVVALGAGSTIKGSVSTDAGAITTSTDVTITGSIGTQVDPTRAGIGTQAGVVTIGARNNINGRLSTSAGAITVGVDSIIGGAATPTGVITLGARVTSGDVISGAGAINIGDNDLLCGKVEAYGAGIVTVTTNVKIDGTISTTAGAITVGAGSSVGGNVTVTGAGVVTMTEVSVAGNVSTTAGAITMTASKVRGSVVASGAGIVTLTATTQNDNTFSVAVACPTTTPVKTPTATAATFDALETNSVWIPTKDAHNPLYTKLAGTPFSFDIAALKIDGTLESAYVAAGAIARHVKLELFDDTGAACSAYTSPVATQTASFTSALLSLVAGRTPSGPFIIDNVHRSLLVRIKECTDSACTSLTNTVPACSTDRFSVRPSAPMLSTTNAMPSAQAPTATASPTMRAGVDFTLFAKTNPVSGYNSTLTLDSSKLSAQWPSQDTSAQSGGTVGVLTPSTLPANAAAVMASYSEAGYLYINPGAYRDDDYTKLSRDYDFNDCINSTANNDYLSDTLINGKYGCSIGNRLTLRMGRFIPDHFSTVLVPDTETVKNTAMPCPAGLICPQGAPTPPPGSIIYSGQSFTITVTARSLGGAPTLNYSGLLAHDIVLQAWSAPGMLAAESQNPVTLYPAAELATHGALSYQPVLAAAFAQGVASANVTYTFPTRYPAIPLAAPTDIYLRAVETAGDGVTSIFATASTSAETGIKVVSGRIYIANNYGSELLAVPIVARAQYWNGTRFINSSTDQKTNFGNLDVTRSNCKKSLNVGGNCMALTISAPVSQRMKNGEIRLLLAAPGAQNIGSIDLSINMFDWLPSTVARIGVGIYKAGPVIYMRETY